jgi:hypothetical protein
MPGNPAAGCRVWAVRTELRRQAADLGVDHSVDIGGVVGRSRGHGDVLKQAALVVLLSEYESQGIAAMEALLPPAAAARGKHDGAG